MKYPRFLLMAAAALLTLPLSSASAGNLAIDTVDNPAGQGISTNSAGFTRGSEFTLSSSLVIDGLGYFDLNSDGLADSHDVGIYTSSGTLVVGPASVSSADPLVASASALGDWRVAPITPVVLDPGDYVIAGYDPSGSDEAPFQSIYNDIPEIDRTLDRRFQSSAGLVFPTTVTQSTFSIVTFTATAVPEPASVAIWSILGLALSGFGYYRARRKE